MKYQAPSGLTAISRAGETYTPDDNGGFDAPESLAAELAAHGCVPAAAAEQATDKVGESRPRARARAEKGI